jgi:hypothetical protein
MQLLWFAADPLFTLFPLHLPGRRRMGRMNIIYISNAYLFSPAILSTALTHSATSDYLK